MGVIAKQYLLSAGSGTKRELDPVLAGAAGAATAVTYTATASGIRRFSPETSNGTTATIPAAPATFSGIGWEMDAVINADPVQFVDEAWTASLELDVTGETTGPNVTYTMIVFVNGAEVGRHAVAILLFAGGINATFGLTAAELNEALVSSVNPKIQIEVYANVTLAAISVGTTTHTIRTNDADSYIDPGDFRIRAARSVPAVGIGAASVSRLLTLHRTFAPAGIGAVVVLKSVKKPLSFVGIGLTSILKKIGKPLAFTGIGAVAILKEVGKPLAFTGIGAATVDRRLTLFRAFPPAAIGAASVARALTIRRSVEAAAVGAASILKKVGKPISAAAIGTVSISKTMRTTFLFVAIGTVTIVKKITKPFDIAAIGAATLSRALTIRRSISASAVGALKIFAKLPIERIPGGGGTTIIKKLMALFDD